jgi:hypothetical protein
VLQSNLRRGSPYAFQHPFFSIFPICLSDALPLSSPLRFDLESYGVILHLGTFSERWFKA